MDDRLPSLDSTTMSWNDDQRDERHGHSRGLLELLSTAPIRAHTQDDSYGPLGNDFNSNSGSVKAGRQIYQPDSFQLNTPASLDGAQFTATFKHPKSIYGDAVSSESERLRLQLKIAELTEENLRLSIENLQLREENRQIRENSREAAQVIEDLKTYSRTHGQVQKYPKQQAGASECSTTLPSVYSKPSRCRHKPSN
ncbi:hypothetical protein K505DRAFT_133357 [Melanomma pulvis-pyrius CBS 109.77]|uniref:Uncharacterized protein n=1 Tax=Melanomma pulvis-pyrius CBS 109.77 TaxID=1314802 RepID=A0A6A6WSH6_9PLEO|nr:hypothetical protein K505DRAFT_133357 [Melanomma pulvis-pyrius CBS 109.77]